MTYPSSVAGAYISSNFKITAVVAKSCKYDPHKAGQFDKDIELKGALNNVSAMLLSFS